jgi:hypothetical protein
LSADANWEAWLRISPRNNVRESAGGQMEDMRLLKFVGLAMLAAALVPTPALAAGGATIAEAPTVAYGQQLFGNTLADSKGETLSDCVDGESWWSLPVHVGDEVKVDWEGGADVMQAWGVGTTDFSIHDAPNPQQFDAGSNAKQESFIKAPATGVMPLRFYSEDEEGFCILFHSSQVAPGPYDFVATVQHALATALAPLPPTGIYPNSVLAGSASLVDGSPLPDGLVFNLVVKWHSSATKKSTSLAYSAATAAGGLAFPLALPAETQGKSVRIVITRPADATYLAVKSVPLKVPVAFLPVSHPKKHHHRRHRHRHKHKHRHHKHRH